EDFLRSVETRRVVEREVAIEHAAKGAATQSDVPVRIEVLGLEILGLPAVRERLFRVRQNGYWVLPQAGVEGRPLLHVHGSSKCAADRRPMSFAANSLISLHRWRSS